MSSVFNSGPFFSRSRSSSHIPELAKVGPKLPKLSSQEELPRSASYTSIPNGDGQYAETGKQALDTISKEGDAEDETREGRKPTKLNKEDRPRLESVGRRKSLVARPKSWMQKVKGSPERIQPADEADSTSRESSPGPTLQKTLKEVRRKSVSESFASFARKSWMGSRSPSPSPSRTPSNPSSRKHSVDHASNKNPLGEVSNERANVLPPPHVSNGSSTQSLTLPRRSTLQKIKERPQSVFMSLTNPTSANSSTSSLPSSADNKSTPRTSLEKVPPVPKTFSTEKLLLGLDGHRRKDELWSAFRSLDNDFSKFQSKSWTLKTNIVRSSLLPFLRNHAAHPTTENLRPEDLERRITVLNKWWNGLLEVLDGRQNQAVSGVDRPVLLEACYCIMVRPEWRSAPSQFAPLSKRASSSPTTLSLSTKQSSASLRSTGSQFIADSIFHNIRTQFIQNLLIQITYVVEKMSLRHAPASLVTFCGKAIAYAFFFVPGIAEALVRVWKLSVENLRQVADDLGLPKRASQQETDDICACFPEHLRNLGWTSPKLMMGTLRQRPTLSIVAAKVNWDGPWTARWCGRDSDLFFVFAKHYFIVAEQHMSSELPLLQKCRAPGFILVQAQLLAALEATINRTAPSEPLPATFDDILAGADATAAALPLPSSNSTRPMAENRLVMLLRDFLSEQSSDLVTARRTFAEVFSKTLQASAHKISLYNHHACLVLCEFMEETMVIFARYQSSNMGESDCIDWCFWLDVCKKVLQSQNSISQIRLFSTIFGLWNMIVRDADRKEALTLGWLLTEETFTAYFCHWCPMVRAYFMRLLCWRLARDDGEASSLDTKIFATLSTRLKTVYSHYLHLKLLADKSNVLPPSTIPSHPAPGRKLLIIRNDNQAAAPNIFLSFDGIMPASQPPNVTLTPFKRHSIAQTDPEQIKLNQETLQPKEAKKRWSILGKTFPPFDLQSPSTSPSVTPSSSPPKNLDEARQEVANARTHHPLSQARDSSTSTPGTSNAYRQYSFKFSLEWAQNFERNVKRNNYPMRIVSPRLPNAAQACIGARVPNIGIEIFPRDPGNHTEGLKYAGRALAEWAVVVGECNSFVDRRRMEGAPGLKWVEVPVLGVDGFRRFSA